MWRALLKITVCVGLISIGNAQTPNDLNKMQQLIKAINAKEGGTIATQFPDAEVVGILETMPEYKGLTALSSADWRWALNSLSTVAPDRTSRVILLHSFENLSSEDYLSFADQSLDLMAAKQIGKDEFLNIVLMSPTKKRWFLSYNYQNPGVINFLNRVRSQFAKDPNIPSLVDFILSGKARERDEILRKENRYFAGQTVDLLPGSSMPTPSQKTTPPQSASMTLPSSSTPRPAASAAPTATVAAKESPRPSFPLVPVAIIVVVIAGVLVFLVRRK